MMARRPGLGKGLEALIPGGIQDLNQPKSDQGVLLIPVNKITPNPHQPRGPVSPTNLEDLAASIQEHGIIQPIIVTKVEGSDQYMLVAGERRWRASLLVGLEAVPAIVRTATQQELLELALIENVQREDLNPLERAQAYQQLIDDFSLTHEAISKQVGKSRVSITNTLRLLNLSEKGQTALIEGNISEGHARALLSLASQRAQDAALDTILKMDLNVRQTETLISKLSGKKPQTQILQEKSSEFKDIEDRLRAFFKTKVNLQAGKKGGNIIIFFYSDEELNAIMDRLNAME
jgi:ParB family chromosome partitioning protein